jgi:pimeloyl-ACP methyl ester carboxylesterase
MKYVGTPAEQIEGMRHAPMWSGLVNMAHTLAYDHTAIMGDTATVPVARAARIKIATLVMVGSASYPFMRESAQTLSAAIPGAQLRTLEGQTHDVNAEVQAPILEQFFGK